ncbi:short-chain dehydrogenase/reductase SDR [Ruminiclostridium papyrosolvens DSM 2782]|uniref:Short-chain dehydrogenase/reductase SDR n=1 Tax=Ruminiclostridium papyrosolvens DSM 2782 TaxID=588581 RepID=F1THI0_9FIRM|nr:SDR family NAD(P)-dependent oxidoreductase [Ruminiclostridium papyrosolvens]EGD46183.1 short-chain dehydrogenase/reductase SDR [Ruminiclostridium papyrosolvens DSM 2782]WES35963.1 SDR family NAD(P)-dependent oxidoreductase [Ruminiclostridium papyrosolvens DSM 2782]
MLEQPVNWGKMKAQLEGKVAVLFGASVGIGAATGRILAESGAKVVLASRNEESLNSLVKEIRSAGGTAVAAKTDVQSYEEVSAAVQMAVDCFGGVDIIVNNAGINIAPQPVELQEDAEFDRVINVNLKGVWYGMKAGIPEIRKRGGGAIVNVSSVGGLVGAPGLTPYCASKHGVIGLSKAAALDCASSGIRVNVIAPGAVDTAMFNDWQKDEEQRANFISLHPLGRVGKPYEIGAAIAWLASDAAAYITGAILPIDGGYIIP